jgi:FG-GAP-like repeat
MKRILCQLVVGLLFLSPTLTAHGVVSIATRNGNSRLISYFENNQWVTVNCQNFEFPANQVWGGTNYIRVGDFNGNGVLDVASPHGDKVFIKTSDPDQIINQPCFKSLPGFTVANLWGGANYTWVGDFNGDRKDDIASASGSSVYMKLSNPGSSLSFTGFTSQTWFLGVNPPLAPQVPLWGGSDYTFVGDFNGDNRDDIASAVGGSVRVQLSTGSSFVSETWNTANDWAIPGWNRVGDFNGDGKDDIASANGGTVHMKLSTGSGFIAANWNVTNGWGGSGYTWVADFNRDGRSDIASANAAAGVIHMKLSTGTGFSCPDWQASNQWGGAQYTWVIDYDNDGYRDIVSAYNGWTIVTKKNAAGTGFTSHSYDYLGSWGPAEYTFALDRSRFSFF